MPSIQKRRTSVAEEIAALQARATKLETFPANGATVLVSSTGANSAMGFSASWANVAFNYAVVSPTIRPIPILAYCTVGQFYGSATGTSSYVCARFACLNNDGPVQADAITGVPLQSGMATVANVTGITQSATFVISGVLPAGPAVGSWYFALQYFCDGGATTGFDVPGPISGTANVTFLVMQLAG